MRMLLRDIFLFSCLVACVAGLVIAAATFLIQALRFSPEQFFVQPASVWSSATSSGKLAGFTAGCDNRQRLQQSCSRIAPIHAPGVSDLVLRNVNTGAFHQITRTASLGAVGLDWQLGDFAADPPTGAQGNSDSTSQLVQAMAGFGGGSGAAESLNTVALGADASQQTLLTRPQHA